MIRDRLRRLARRALQRLRPEASPPATAAATPSVEVALGEAQGWLASGALLLDVREPNELFGGYPSGARLIPMRQVEARLDELPRDQHIIVLCAAGARAHHVATALQAYGFDAWALQGGFGAWVGGGGLVTRPPTHARFAIASRVRHDGRPASVQEVVETSEGMRYTVLPTARGSALVAGVRESELAAEPSA